MTHVHGKAMKWILLGCGGLFLVGALAIGGCIVLIMGVTKAPVEAGEKFLTAMADGKEADARALVDPAQAAAIMPLLKDAADAWGKTWSITQRYVATNNGVTTATVGAKVTGRDSKERTITLALVKAGETWLVAGVRIEGGVAAGEKPAERTEPPAGILVIGTPEIKVTETRESWKVALRYDVTGMKKDTAGGRGRVALLNGIVLKSPAGDVMLEEPELKTFDGAAEGEVTFTNDLTIPRAGGPGTYLLQATVKDHLSGQSITRDIEIRLPK